MLHLNFIAPIRRFLSAALSAGHFELHRDTSPRQEYLVETVKF